LNFIFVEGRIINLAMVSRIEFDPETRVVRMIIDDGGWLFGGFDDEGQDAGTPLWEELKKMARFL
jgi:hypothetical protein